MIQRSDNTIELYLDDAREVIGLRFTASDEVVISDVIAIDITERTKSCTVNETYLPAIIKGIVTWTFQPQPNVNGIIIVCDNPSRISDIDIIESGYEERCNKVTRWQNSPDDVHYPSERLVYTTVDSLTHQVNQLQSNIQRIRQAEIMTTDMCSKDKVQFIDWMTQYLIYHRQIRRNSMHQQKVTG